MAVIVSGHVFVKEVKITPKKIQVDTTGGKLGQLSAICLPSGKIIQSQA
jgi:hypothetical protein